LSSKTWRRTLWAGSVAGVALAEQIEAGNLGTPLGLAMSGLVADITADQGELEFSWAVGIDKSRLKQTGGWLAEKVTIARFSELGTGSPVHPPAGSSIFVTRRDRRRRRSA